MNPAFLGGLLVGAVLGYVIGGVGYCIVLNWLDRKGWL
jgi:hypothetical protein